MPLLPITPTTFTPWRASVSNSMPREAERAVAEQQHDLAIGMRELRRQRIAGARAQAAERPRVKPAAGLVAVDHAARVGDEVAAVADHDRVAVEHLARAPRTAASGAAARAPSSSSARSASRRSVSAARSSEIHALARAAPCAPAAGAQVRERLPERRRSTPPPTGRGWLRSGSATSITTISVSSPNDAAEAEPEVHRHADHERHVGAFQRLRARAREEQLVVGRHAAARQAVEEHRDPQRLAPARAAPPRRAPSRGRSRP